MTNDLTTRVAKQIAFHGRNIHDVSKDAEEFWENTGTDARDIALIQARAVVALVLGEAANVCERHEAKAIRQGRGDFIAHKTDAAAIRALGDKK